MKCTKCNMPIVDSGLDRCFCPIETKTDELKLNSYQGSAVSVNDRIIGYVQEAIFTTVKPFIGKPFSKEDLVFEVQKAMSYSIPITRIFFNEILWKEVVEESRQSTREVLLKNHVSYIPAVETAADLPIDPDVKLPIGCWVKSAAQYYYSTTGDTWLSQSEVFPEDFPRRPSTFPNLPEPVIKIRDGNI